MSPAVWEWARHIGYELDGMARTPAPPELDGKTVAEKATRLAEALADQGADFRYAARAAKALQHILEAERFDAAHAAQLAHHLADVLRPRHEPR